jgi:hypothetical protein
VTVESVGYNERPMISVLRARPLTREALLAGFLASATSALLLWAGPPGIDLAGHAYQRVLFLRDGFSLWNNFWYAGRYSFVTYSILYYPLAGLLGIKLLALASIATAALAFAIVLGREWGLTARASSRSFAVVWAGTALSAAFPFALGAALALLALWALQDRRRVLFGVLAVLTLAASPLAFVLLALFLVGIGIARRDDRAQVVVPAAIIVGAGLVELLLFRVFPGGGTFPFSTAELIPAIVFCVLGFVTTWRVERARPLQFFFIVYLAACIVTFVVPSQLGENIERVRYAALPIAVLALSLRSWRPLRLALPVLVLAAIWNTTPLAANFTHAAADPTAERAYWRPAVAYLHDHLGPSYRVEAVDTVGHWPAVYLPEAGIPLARGWYRQDDFPENKILYGSFGAKAYVAWLRSLGVRYVVLARAPPDYSSRAEAVLLRGGHSGLRPVLRTSQLTIFAVPHARPLVTGPHAAAVERLGATSIRLRFDRSGTYRVAVRYSPYWHASAGCIARGPDGMLRVSAIERGSLELSFKVGATRVLETLVGADANDCGG